MRKSEYLLDEKSTIECNGEKYYLRIRTNNIEKPVVLFLHGGPGSPDRPQILHHLSSLADDCVMVCWDQRGAGLAYNSKRAKTEVLTQETYIKDAVNVINYLRERFNMDKIILVGHSFGSQYALWVLENYSELVSVYVGIGQFIDSVKNEDIAFKFVMDEAVKRNDRRAIKKLKSAGPPVNGIYKDGKFIIKSNYLHKFGGSLYGSSDGMIMEYLKLARVYLKEYSLPEMIRYLKGVAYISASPMAQHREKFLETVKELKVPVCLLLGRHDYNCSFELGAEWFEQLKAPYKKLIRFENSAHTPQFEEPELWCETFKKEVLEKFS